MIETYLNEQTEVRIRPLREDDADRWYDFVMSCSKRTIYSRYNHARQFTADEIRGFCKVDENLELAYVATVHLLEEEIIVGEVRLYRFEENPKHAEFAIMVSDEWQSQGVGTLMTQEILSVARQKGIEKIIAYTESDNHKMLAIFKKMGFDSNVSFLDPTVDLTKLLL